MSDFSEWFGARLEAHGVSQRELALKIGVGHSALKTWLTGYANPTWHTCRAIADALGEDRAYVRQLAGYVDPDEEPATAHDPGVSEWLALYEELQPEDKPSALLVMRALRDSGRRRGR